MAQTTPQQILALGLGCPLRRIEQALAIRRETIGGYLKAAGIAVHGGLEGAGGLRPI